MGFIRFSLIILLMFFVNAAFAATQITDMRVEDGLDHTRFVLDSLSPPKYQVLALENPSRLVLDIMDAQWDTNITGSMDSGRIAQVRHHQKTNGNLRVVLDVNQPIKSFKTFTLFPESDRLSHLVVDVYSDVGSLRILPVPVAKDGRAVGAPMPTRKPKNITPYKPLIIIDAGHGGHDPGASGRKRTKEKYVTLEYAKALESILLDSGRYRVQLTRSSDRYIPLQQRVRIAQRAKGDLFISLHADSHRNRKTRGLSVYTLSERASDKEAAALARNANTSGNIGTIHFDEEPEDADVSNLLVDLAQRGTKNQSASFAEMLVDHLQKKVTLLRNTHRFAGFRVLTAPDIPSVLVELGYLSNPTEETLLRTSHYRKKIVSAMHRAIDSYFKEFQPRQ